MAAMGYELSDSQKQVGRTSTQRRRLSTRKLPLLISGMPRVYSQQV